MRIGERHFFHQMTAGCSGLIIDPAKSQLQQQLFIIPPVFHDFRAEFQIDLPAGEFFDLPPCVLSDLPDHRSAFPDHDPLVGFTVKKKGRADIRILFAPVLIFLNADRDGMRNLIVEIFEQRFADQVSGDIPFVKIRDLIRVIESGAFRQAGSDFSKQFRNPGAAAS